MRTFLIVMDSFGCGAAPDAADFGDAGIDRSPPADTLGTVARSPYFHAPNLSSMGLFDAADKTSPDGATPARELGGFKVAYGKLRELSAGKDTVTGHWELCGVVSPKAMPTFPDGFPPEVINALENASGRGIICNKPYSGTAVIADYGARHMETGELIVYTSADSVLQIAAHEQIVPVPELYRVCEAARELMSGKYAVGRVIARPFIGVPGAFVRTANRHDYALPPPSPTLLDRLKESGRDVIALGKINDIFAGRGITRFARTESNADGVNKLLRELDGDFDGLCFLNLVDFDSAYGHRNDIDGYARAVSEFDAALPEIIRKLHGDDALIITADHGCDPGYPTTDHTREYVPFLSLGIASGKLGERAFGFVSDVIARRYGI